MNERHDRCALTARGGDAFHGTGPDVADREHTWHGGGEGARRYAVEPVLAGNLSAGEHVALLVEQNL
jgi:hypothetical protein